VSPEKPVDSKQRFSSRVERYVKYRPNYPAAVLDALREWIGLDASWVVADVGSGTGISAELFLRRGNTVYAVEPNREMRETAETLLAGYEKLHSIDGSAEQTTLAPGSIDLIVAGQAFHWFDPAEAKREFQRILGARRWVVLMWNVRRVRGTPFLEAYERLLLSFASDYSQVRHENIDAAALGSFFAPGGYQTLTFPNEQAFDYAGLEGRLLSSSYTPDVGQPGYGEMLAELRRIFGEFQSSGQVTIEYDTEVHISQLG
jgi:SAM-dependent methyltransferase